VLSFSVPKSGGNRLQLSGSLGHNRLIPYAGSQNASGIGYHLGCPEQPDFIEGVLKIVVRLDHVKSFFVFDLIGARLAPAFLSQLSAFILAKSDSAELQELKENIFENTSTLIYRRKGLEFKKELTLVNITVQLLSISLDLVGFLSQLNSNLGVCL